VRWLVSRDADWNEQVAIVSRWLRMLALDTFGPVGVPLTTPQAFRIGLVEETPTWQTGAGSRES
jgi:hypothetical protein